MAEFDPADNTIDAVNAHLKKNPQDTQRVLDAEKARGEDARSTLVSSLEEQVASQHEAPEAVEPKAVEVGPAPTPSSTSLLGKNYEVTPERGHRLLQS